MSKTNILLLPGDGVGPEIMQEATKVINLLNDLESHEKKPSK